MIITISIIIAFSFLLVWLNSDKEFTANRSDYSIEEIKTASSTWYVAMFKGKPILPEETRFSTSKAGAEMVINNIINRILFNENLISL